MGNLGEGDDLSGDIVSHFEWLNQGLANHPPPFRPKQIRTADPQAKVWGADPPGSLEIGAETASPKSPKFFTFLQKKIGSRFVIHLDHFFGDSLKPEICKWGNFVNSREPPNNNVAANIP